jgi:hypothetical protein
MTPETCQQHGSAGGITVRSMIGCRDVGTASVRRICDAACSTHGEERLRV